MQFQLLGRHHCPLQCLLPHHDDEDDDDDDVDDTDEDDDDDVAQNTEYFAVICVIVEFSRKLC